MIYPQKKSFQCKCRQFHLTSHFKILALVWKLVGLFHIKRYLFFFIHNFIDWILLVIELYFVIRNIAHQVNMLFNRASLHIWYLICRIDRIHWCFIQWFFTFKKNWITRNNSTIREKSVKKWRICISYCVRWQRKIDISFPKNTINFEKGDICVWEQTIEIEWSHDSYNFYTLSISRFSI